MIYPEIYKLYTEHLSEQKELAFERWRKSGYRDLKAHAAFLDRLTTLAAVNNQVRMNETSKNCR
jgi:hypothetical protein